MQVKPINWDTYYRGNIQSQLEYKVVIDTTEYYKQDIYSMKITKELVNNDTFNIGNIIPKTLDIVITQKSIIPKASNIEIYVRYNGELGTTDWIKQGKFFILERSKAPNNKWRLTCKDDVFKMEQPFINTEAIPDFPMLMTDALNIISTRMNIEIETETLSLIDADLKIEYTNDMSIKEVLRHIASANAGNFTLTDENKLRLIVPRNLTAEEIVELETISCKSFDEINDTKTISRVTMYHADEEYFTSGDDTGDELILDNPFATQYMVDSVLNKIKGYIHRPYECRGAFINPVIELGDRVKFKDFICDIYVSTIFYSGVIKYDIESPGESIVEQEYRYEGQLTKSLKRKVSTNTPYYGVTIGRENGLRIEKTDGSSEAIFNSDKLAFRALENGVMKDKLYFDPILGKYVFDGTLSATMIEALEAEFDVTVSNVTITQTLAAETGNIAQLTVDQLETSDKVQRYLRGDKSDVNYLRANGQFIKLITASTDGLETVQAEDRHGNKLYWVDETYNGTRLDPTAFPVLIYKYIEQVKAEIGFYDINGNYIPKITLGLGDGVTVQSAKAEVFKGQTGLELNYYKSNTGELTQLLIDDNGIRQKGNKGLDGLRNVYIGPLNTVPSEPQHGDLRIITGGV